MEVIPIEVWLAKYEDAEIILGESGLLPMKLSEQLDRLDPDMEIRYLDPKGGQELREKISEDYTLDADHVLVTNGATEAVYTLYSTQIEPGDEVIIELPIYQPLWEVAQAKKAAIKEFWLTPEEEYRPNIDQLNELATKDTKLIVINHPHNPTGSVISESELKAMYEIAEDNDALLISDELYRGLEFGEAIIPAVNLGEHAISINGMSKLYGLPGHRIGWITGKEEVITKCWEYRHMTSLCNNVITEYLALSILTDREHFIKLSRDRMFTNFNILSKWMDHQNVMEWVPPQAGVVTFPKYNLDIDSYTFCHNLVEEKDVVLVPGMCFAVENRVRLGYGYETEKLKEGLERIDEYIETLS